MTKKKEGISTKSFLDAQANAVNAAKTLNTKDNKPVEIGKKQPAIKNKKPSEVEKKPLPHNPGKGKKQPLSKDKKPLEVEKKPLPSNPGKGKKQPLSKNNKALAIGKALPLNDKKALNVKKKDAPNKKKSFVVHLAPKTFEKGFFEKNKSLFTDLLRIHAYYGDTHYRNHSSQDSFVYAYRNNHSLYNPHLAIFNLKRALHFLKRQDPSKFVFVGSPMDAKEKMSLLFEKLKLPFFASAEWSPGFISKKDYDTSKILVIYDIHTNHEAKNEAFKAASPIVGFFSIHADVNGVDYPINLNLEGCGSWYYMLWKSFFQSKKYVTGS
jgi:hypothetical protein